MRRKKKTYHCIIPNRFFWTIVMGSVQYPKASAFWQLEVTGV
jgi:hypothetical protein